ncbi:hypothetical protein CEV33_2676 [Brucella grignonensis]|uniref:Uncharacterized protein n=1 Tax=Brucella grignonensis TaxID=94627 RepID=A0A256F279_9HYPH|nr:hypothetical protein CEV33_2676 [Brucella grignonensis]
MEPLYFVSALSRAKSSRTFAENALFIFRIIPRKTASHFC